MEKMGWRALQGVACLLNRHWSLVLAFSFMNVSVKREWATAWPPLRRARAAGAARVPAAAMSSSPDSMASLPSSLAGVGPRGGARELSGEGVPLGAPFELDKAI